MLSTKLPRTFMNSGLILAGSGDSIANNPNRSTLSSAKPPTTQKESKYKLLDLSEEKFRDFILSQLNKFDCRMEYDAEVLNFDYSVRSPTEAHIVDYAKYVTIASKMENEIPIICLIYIERLLLNTGILLNKYNWQRMLLTCLCLASKIWDDDSLEN